ncbi:hypothetical protein HHI36_019884 [Cryptolaemus montrouzieri]|uniref:C2H2-type domain-containing protein n=1 Tax=Cryptolaemus montrouzieri TaxID=559131 RepID=A0ABD2N8N5_9CUCU
MGKTDNDMKECSECKSTFIRQSDLLRHIKRFHPSKAEKLLSGLENKIYPFKCEECDKGFLHKRNLNFHQKSHSTVVNSGVLIRKKCPLCDHVATFKKDFYDHCREVHDILLDVVKMDFANNSDFENWKSEIEKALDSKFVKEYGSTAKMTNYICDQSEYSILENGVEVEGSQTNKVNGFCPAGFRVMHEASGKCSIYFVKTHICNQNRSLIFPNNLLEEHQSPKEKKKESLKVKQQKTNSNEYLEITKSLENQSDNIIELTSTSPIKKKSEKKLVSPRKKSFIIKKKEMIKTFWVL